MIRFLLFCLMFSGLVYSQSEFIVNTYLDSTQRDPQIARDAVGNYLIVWDSESQISASSQSDIFYQKFDASDQKIGTETQVNTTISGEQEKPALAMNEEGDFVIVWASHTGAETIFDIHARLYRAGLAPGDEFPVNTTTLHSQTKPDADIDNNGNFVIVWESWFQDGSDRGIYAQRYDGSGFKAGPEFRVNSTTAYSQGRPVVKYFDDGSFIIIWESWKQDILTPSGYGIFGKIFSSDGNALTDEIQINAYTNDYQWFGDVETYPDGSFICVWCSWEEDGFDGGIYMQKFDPNGNRLGNETIVNRTTVYYQWLPRITSLPDGSTAITWSSWKTDGNREGVYITTFDDQLKKTSFETLVNEYTDSFQWEPDLIPGNTEGEVLVVWASWGQHGKENDYDIMAKRFVPFGPQGAILPSTYEHISGISSTKILVHVVDSTALTGDTYEVSFQMSDENSATALIKDLTTSTNVVTDFQIASGENVFYLTDSFDGAAVEFVPSFTLALDKQNSYFKNHSGTNIIFEPTEAVSGNIVLAPIDISVGWGNTDTLSNGSYAVILDYGYSVLGIKEIELPFIAWNETDDYRVDLFIIENPPTENLRWDPGEKIVFITPEEYQNSFPNFHAQLESSIPAGALIMPDEGDTNFVLTKKPLTENDVFRFTTNPAYITTGLYDHASAPGRFELFQNYPNPFNPATTLVYSIPENGIVKIKVFNILGEKIKTVVNQFQRKGKHRILFNGSGLASGVYLYSIEFGNKFITKKMLLLK